MPKLAITVLFVQNSLIKTPQSISETRTPNPSDTWTEDDAARVVDRREPPQVLCIIGGNNSHGLKGVCLNDSSRKGVDCLIYGMQRTWSEDDAAGVVDRREGVGARQQVLGHVRICCIVRRHVPLPGTPHQGAR